MSVYSGPDQRKHRSSASLAFVWGIYRWLVNSPHKGPVTRKTFPFDDVIIYFIMLAYKAIITNKKYIHNKNMIIQKATFEH